MLGGGVEGGPMNTEGPAGPLQMPRKQRPDPSKCPEIAKGRIEFTASITQAPNASKTLRAGSSLRPQSPRAPTQRPDPSKYREIKGWTPPNTPKTKAGPLQMFQKQSSDPSKCPFQMPHTFTTYIRVPLMALCVSEMATFVPDPKCMCVPEKVAKRVPEMGFVVPEKTGFS